MHTFSAISGAAVLLALAPSALAVGSASVFNQCGTDVYYKTISTSEKAYQLVPSGGVHESFTQPGVGVSIKLSFEDSASAPISQFEYTWADGKIAYDLSNIDGDPASPDGYPFAKGGMVVTPSSSNDTNNPTCVPVNCPAGTTVCTAAYNAPDDPRTMVCDEDVSLVLTLCPGGAGKKRDAHVHKYEFRGLHQPRHPHARV